MNKNDMNENINLCDLLRGHEGKKIFLVDAGEVTITHVGASRITVQVQDRDWVTELTEETLDIQPTGFAYIYPSKESFLSNPFNARKAWNEWAEAWKPKIWRAEEDEMYWFIDSQGRVFSDFDEYTPKEDMRYFFGNYFKTRELADEAADQIRALLQKFHEEHPQI